MSNYSLGITPVQQNKLMYVINMHREFYNERLDLNGVLSLVRGMEGKETATIQDDKIYMTTSKEFKLDIGTTTVHLLLGTVFTKKEDQILIIKGGIVTGKVTNFDTEWYNPCSDMVLRVVDIKGKCKEL